MRKFDVQHINLHGALRLRAGARIVVKEADGTESEVDSSLLGNLLGATRVATLTEANTLTAADSGKAFYLDAAGGFDTTLPAPTAGVRYRFIVATAPTGADYGIASTAQSFVGGINELEVDTANDGPYSNGADSLEFKANFASQGDWVDIESDGNKWYVTGQTRLDGGLAFTAI
jgi:hypothetical protein